MSWVGKEKSRLPIRASPKGHAFQYKCDVLEHFSIAALGTRVPAELRFGASRALLPSPASKLITNTARAVLARLISLIEYQCSPAMTE